MADEGNAEPVGAGTGRGRGVLHHHPRQPADLQGLLRFAIEASRADDHQELEPAIALSPPSALDAMDPERRQFLEEALNNLSVNVTSELQKGIQILSNKRLIRSLDIEKPVPREIMEQFYNLEDYVSHIDNAIGFYKLGGYSIFPVCLSCEHPSIRSASCNLIGELCQSNPFCQAKVLECGYLHTLMNMLNCEPEDEVLSKALYGISCIVRHYEPCTSAFLENDGYGMFNKIFQGTRLDLHNKAAFLLCAIYSETKDMGEKIVTTGVFRNLIAALPKTYHPLCDQIFRLLSMFIANNDTPIIEEIRNPEHNLKKSVLKYYEQEYNNGMDYSEEISYCETILKIFKHQSESSAKDTDAFAVHLDR